ncbi:hypothetical protein BH09ACT3_BH09ACT3_15800 [soil metagenome]
MSLGLPSHLAVRAVTESFGRALNSIGLVCLASALLGAIAFQAAEPTAVLWPAMIAVAPMAVSLLLNRWAQTWFTAVSYLAIGAACIYWYILTFSSQTQPILTSDAFSVSSPKIALLVVAGPGFGFTRAALWMAAGYLAAEVAAAAAILRSGHGWSIDVTTAVTFLAVVVVLALSHLSLRRFRRAQPVLHRSMRDEEVASMRFRLEAKAAALMHDTVLSHLAALSSAPDGVIDPALRRQIDRDLEVLTGEEWLNDRSGLADEEAGIDWQRSGLRNAIEESRALGLEVEATGDLAAVSALGAEASIALGQAAKQCLVNVLRHAGTGRAEVVVYGTGAEVSVMVIDAGRGFSVAETGSDRLGLRHSVTRRIELVGGTVQVWSTPGHGTSIMIRMPIVEGDPAVAG